MIIGVDIRALQTGHKYRGIGEVTKQVTNRLLKKAAQKGDQVIFYEYSDDDPKELLTIPKELDYSVIKQGFMPEKAKRTSLQKTIDILRQLYGNPIKDSQKSDVFLQFDYAFGVPKNTKTVLIKHDLIPLIFWNDFFESAWVPFKNRALRTTARTLFANYKYKRILKRSLKNARTIVTVSKSTKRDIVKFCAVKPSKIKVAHLGVDLLPAKTNNIDTTTCLPTKKYILFVGAADERRRVDDLVSAYNNLKAEGHDIQLVLVGENFKSPKTIPNKHTRDAVLSSSYAEDILTLGYVNDETKQKLFKEALAFVYPTKYEGFGIPLLEAFLLETAVVSYKNSSIPEVGGEHVIYAKDWMDIKLAIQALLAEKKEARIKRIKAAKKYAQGFTWDKTASMIYQQLKNG